jgi:hypothetical protein
MNKLIAVLYVLYFVSYMLGCVTKDEIHMEIDRSNWTANGYMVFDGEVTEFSIELD